MIDGHFTIYERLILWYFAYLLWVCEMVNEYFLGVWFMIFEKKIYLSVKFGILGHFCLKREVGGAGNFSQNYPT